MKSHLVMSVIYTAVFVLSIVLSKGNSTIIVLVMVLMLVGCAIEGGMKYNRDREEKLKNFKYRPSILSRPHDWEEDAQRRWVAPTLAQHFKQDMAKMPFFDLYICGICGYAYFTTKGVDACCSAAKAAGVEPNPLIEAYGNSAIVPHMRPTTTVTGMGYPGQFDRSSSNRH